jgi:hypothetical protein
MNSGVPSSTPSLVIAGEPVTRAMPKSMTRGPSAPSRTFCGLRSRCTTPAAWMLTSASASPAPSDRSRAAPNTPSVRTACHSEGPGTKTVASQGVAQSVSASISGAV